MRPIKFRFRIEIPTGFYIPDEPAHIESFMYSLDELINTPPLILTHSMTRVLSCDQSVGLTDKHSVEIYEGDILRWKYIDEGTGVVKYSERAASYKPFNQLRLEVVDKFEIIGNMYDSPELLERAA